METFRKFVNKYITEENEKFTKQEFRKAIVVVTILSALLIAVCL